MSQKQDEEEPLTAAAFKIPAASRHEVTSRLVYPSECPPRKRQTQGDDELSQISRTASLDVGPSGPTSTPPFESRSLVESGTPKKAAPAIVSGMLSTAKQSRIPSTELERPCSVPETEQVSNRAQSVEQRPRILPSASASVVEPVTGRGIHPFTKRTRKAVSPASWGWRSRVCKWSGGLLTLAPGQDEEAHRAALAQVQVAFPGPRTIVFVNPKGGAGTTTSVLMAAHCFGVHRGGGVVAWDNNETRGALGSRCKPGPHGCTARELLENLDSFENSAAGIADLGRYLRQQETAHFDLLASDERSEATGHIASRDVSRLHALFQRFYRLILIDTGNNMKAANWLAAMHGADLVVVTTTIRQDSASSALWMLDALEKDVYGPGNLKSRAITVMAEPAPTYDARLRATMMTIFGARTRTVCPIPYEPALVDGGIINYDRLSRRSHTAWLFACAAMASALRPTTEGERHA